MMESKRDQLVQTEISEFWGLAERDSVTSRLSKVQEQIRALIRNCIEPDDSALIDESRPIRVSNDPQTASERSKLFRLLDELADSCMKRENEVDHMRSLIRQLERKLAVAKAMTENRDKVPELEDTFSKNTGDQQERQSDQPNSRNKPSPGATTVSMDSAAWCDYSMSTLANVTFKTPSKQSARAPFATSTPFTVRKTSKNSFQSCYSTPAGASVKKVYWSERPPRPFGALTSTATPRGDSSYVRTPALISAANAELRSTIPKVQLNDDTIQSLAAIRFSEVDIQRSQSASGQNRSFGAGTSKKRRSGKIEGGQNVWMREIRKPIRNPIRHRINKAFLLRLQSSPNFRHNHRTGSTHFYSRKRRISKDKAKRELIAVMLQNAERV